MSLKEAAGRLLRWMPLTVSLGLLALIVTQFESSSLLANMDLRFLLIGLAAALLINTGLAAFKWWVLITYAKVTAGFCEIWRLLMGLLPATLFAPFQSSHLVYAIALQRAKKLSTFKAIEIVAYDRWASLASTFVLIAVGQTFADPNHFGVDPLILAGALVVVMVYFTDYTVFRILGRFRLFRERSALLRHRISLKRKIWLLVLGTVYQSSDMFSMYFVCRAMGLDISVTQIFGVYPLLLLLTYVPISVNGFGVRENLVFVFFSGVLSYDQAIGAGIGVALLEYICPALFGVIALPSTLRTIFRSGSAQADPPQPDPIEPDS